MKASKITMPVTICRKISTKENENSGTHIYTGQAPITSFINLPEEENVREYTVEAGLKKRRSGVHLSIFETLVNNPEKFPILNGGISIVAHGVKIAENQKEIVLLNPSIINGSQTRGVIKDFLKEQGPSNNIPSVKYEVIVTEDDDLITETSIARNNQNAVKAISILGAREVFSELDVIIKKSTGKQLRKSETDRGDEYIQTEKLLQVIAALIPNELWPATGKSSESRVFTYTGQAGPLKLFEKVYNDAKATTGVRSEQKILAQELYNFYLDIAPHALDLYEKWHSGQPFAGKNWKHAEAIVRDKESKEIQYAHDGVIFPILAAYSVFCCKAPNGKWIINIPKYCDDDRLVKAAHEAFANVHRKPHLMGRTESCYSQIRNITETLKTVLDQVSAA